MTSRKFLHMWGQQPSAVRRSEAPQRPSGRSILSFAMLLVGFSCPTLFAQGPVPDTPMPSVEPAPAIVSTPPSEINQHKFWDRENWALFATAAAFNGTDFAVTRANLQSGGQELNPVVRVFGRSTAGLAINFGGETAGVIGLSYFFHKTRHHKLERIVSMANIGVSAAAVSYGLAHR